MSNLPLSLPPRILVMPFDNVAGDSRILWMGEAASVLLVDDLNAQTFFPMPEGAVEDPGGYENTLMVGNGPYMMEAARTDEEIVLVKNDTWTGDINGETWDDRLDRITFRTSADPDTAYNAFEAGEADTAQHPAGPGDRGRRELGHDARRRGARLVPLVLQPARPAHRWSREPPAAPGDLAGDRPRDDQRGRVQRHPHRLHGHHASGHPRLQGGPLRLLRLRP